jgi:hypothetical protein
MAPSNVPNINKIIGTPTFQTLIKLKLNNTSSVPSNLGGAQNGYLGLILAAPAYAAIVGTDAMGAPQPFITPTFPSAVPMIVGINEVAREAELCKFEADTYAWCKYNNMCKVLQKQIISAVDNVYIKAKKTRSSSYNKVSINQLLVHLFTQYGDINPNNLANNNKRVCIHAPLAWACHI